MAGKVYGFKDNHCRKETVDKSHNHDDRYYHKSSVDDKLKDYYTKEQCDDKYHFKDDQAFAYGKSTMQLLPGIGSSTLLCNLPDGFNASNCFPVAVYVKPQNKSVTYVNGYIGCTAYARFTEAGTLGITVESYSTSNFLETQYLDVKVLLEKIKHTAVA